MNVDGCALRVTIGVMKCSGMKDVNHENSTGLRMGGGKLFYWITDSCLSIDDEQQLRRPRKFRKEEVRQWYLVS